MNWKISALRSNLTHSTAPGKILYKSLADDVIVEEPGVSQLIDIVSLKAAFVGATYCKIHPILIRYTVEFRNDLLFAQIIVFDSATESELDDTMDILGNIVGEFSTLVADFEMIKLETLQAVENIAPLKIRLFQRAL